MDRILKSGSSFWSVSVDRMDFNSSWIDSGSNGAFGSNWIELDRTGSNADRTWIDGGSNWIDGFLVPKVKLWTEFFQISGKHL